MSGEITMSRKSDRTEVQGGSREEIRIRRALLQFVTGHPYWELPPPVAVPRGRIRQDTPAHRSEQSPCPDSIAAMY